MREKLNSMLNLIRGGYNFELREVVIPDYENELEITELYLSVENPDYRPDDGSDPNIVIKL